MLTRMRSNRFLSFHRLFLPLAVFVCSGAATAATPSVSDDKPPIVPTTVISLYTKGAPPLAGFYTWLAAFGHEDPDRVFTVVDAIDGAPAIRISGQHHGGLVTRQRYANYKLVAEFRWGSLTWGARKDRARDAGILLHGQGEDGNYAKDFKAPWLRSVEYQIIEGGTGDLLLLPGYDRGSPTPTSPRLTVAVAEGSLNWNPQGTPKEFSKGRLDWQYRDKSWKDALGFRGARDVEKPVGEWNRIEILCRGGDQIFFLNGVKVNEGFNGSYTAGRLLFQSEGAEIFFRRIELHPLPE